MDAYILLAIRLHLFFLPYVIVSYWASPCWSKT